MAEFFTTLTLIGEARFANAPVLGELVDFAEIAVGDGNGSYNNINYESMRSRTTLINEVWRGAVNNISNHETNGNWIIVETLIPSTEGDFEIREAGVFDSEGRLLATAKYPYTYKPTNAQGVSSDLYVRMILQITDTSLVTIQVDPTIVMATRQYVSDEISTTKQYVDDEISATRQYVDDEFENHIDTNIGKIILIDGVLAIEEA